MAADSFSWRGRRVLVTGCTGFLGGAVARELFARGAEVVGLVHDRPAPDLLGPGPGGRIRLVHGRTDNVFRLHSAMAVHEIAAVFHLAAQDPFAEDRGTCAVLQAAKLYSRRIPVVAARPSPPPGTARAEERHEYGLSVARFGEVFGPGDRKVFRIVPATAIGLVAGDTPPPADGRPATVPAGTPGSVARDGRLATVPAGTSGSVARDGRLATVPAGTSGSVARDGQARDFVFVRDAARACLLTAEATVASGPGEYEFRSGWLLTERQMAAAVRAAHAGRPASLPELAPPANPLGWVPQQPLTEALDETLTWYREFVRAGCAVPVRVAA